MTWIEILPWINALFAFYLVMLIVFRLIKKKAVGSAIIQVFTRSMIVLLVTGFFVIRPINNTFYRNTVIRLNAGNDDLISTLTHTTSL